jgi:hypothetical protein
VPASWLGFNLSDTRLATPGLRRAVVPEEFVNSYPTGLVTGGLVAPDVAVLDNALVLRPGYNFSANLALGDLQAVSPGAQQVWGVWGQPGSWVLLATSGLGSGFSGHYFQTTAPLTRGQWAHFDLHLWTPDTPTLFSFQLGFGGSLALRVDETGVGTIWEQRSGSYELRAQGPFFFAPLWNRHLSLSLVPLRRNTVYLESGDGQVLKWRNPNPITTFTNGTPDYVPFRGQTVDLAVAQARVVARYVPGTWATANGGLIAVARGPVLDLGRVYTGGLRGTFDADLLPGQGVVSWVEDVVGDTAALGRTVRPVVSLSTEDRSRTPYVYNFGILADPVAVTVALASIDLSATWESLVWSRSADDLSAEVEAQLGADYGEDAVSGYLRRLAGFDVDGTPWWRAYLSPYVETVGPYDRVVLRGRGRLDRLERSLLDGEETFAGQDHTEAMRQLLQGAGLVETTDFTIAAEAAPVAMPARDGGQDDPTTPSPGTSRREYANYVCGYVSGWALRELANGTLYYAPKTGTDRGAWYEDDTAEGQSWKRWVLGNSWKENRDVERFRNEVWVVGQGPDGQGLAGFWIDEASQDDPTAANYMGERRLLVYVDPSLNTAARVEEALDLIVADVGTLARRASWQSEFDPDVAVYDTLTFRARTWQIVGQRVTVTGPAVHAMVEYEAVEQSA